MFCAPEAARSEQPWVTARAYIRTRIRKKWFIIQEITPLFCQVCETLNPKIMLIIEQFFPQIVDRHIRTRSSLQSALESLDRYRALGCQAIRNLSNEDREANMKVLDEAYHAAVRRLKEFHDQESEMSGMSGGSGSTEAS